jgi:hypothetical protein
MTRVPPTVSRVDLTRSEREIVRLLLRQHIRWAERQFPSGPIIDKQADALSALAKLEAFDAR